jgi:hypothetical protein
METNKGNDWLGVITISNCETMSLVHDSQVINHMTKNKEKKETHLVG